MTVTWHWHWYWSRFGLSWHHFNFYIYVSGKHLAPTSRVKCNQSDWFRIIMFWTWAGLFLYPEPVLQGARSDPGDPLHDCDRYLESGLRARRTFYRISALSWRERGEELKLIKLKSGEINGTLMVINGGLSVFAFAFPSREGKERERKGSWGDKWNSKMEWNGWDGMILMIIMFPQETEVTLNESEIKFLFISFFYLRRWSSSPASWRPSACPRTG